MTEPTTTPAADTTATTEAKPKPAPRKTAAKKAPVKKEFAPKVTDTGRLDHTDCGHDRTPKGRSACRAEYAKTLKQG